MIRTLILLAALTAVLVALYECGVMAMQSKRAVLFVGSINGCRASFSNCTGTIRRVMRFAQSGEYRFTLSGAAEQGEIICTMIDADGTVCAQLKPGESTVIAAEKGKRYCVRIRMEHATGKYELRREAA